MATSIEDGVPALIHPYIRVPSRGAGDAVSQDLISSAPASQSHQESEHPTSIIEIHESASVVDEMQPVSPYSKALAKRVIRKIDRRILVIMFVTYVFNFMDKTILSSASVFGLIEDNHLVGKQYSWVGSMFYFGYLLWEYPTTLLIQRVPIGKYLSVVTLFWGAIVACTAACSSFGGLVTVRFLLGVAVSVYLSSMNLDTDGNNRKLLSRRLVFISPVYGLHVMRFQVEQGSGSLEIVSVASLHPSSHMESAKLNNP